MEVRHVMTRGLRMARASEPVREAARAMADQDVGVLPVSDGGRLVGVITDHDIVVRAVAADRSPAEVPVREVMSEAVLFCFEDEPVEEAARSMIEMRLRRLPVLDRSRRLVGVIDLADIAREGGLS